MLASLPEAASEGGAEAQPTAEIDAICCSERGLHGTCAVRNFYSIKAELPTNEMARLDALREYRANREG